MQVPAGSPSLGVRAMTSDGWSGRPAWGGGTRGSRDGGAPLSCSSSGLDMTSGLQRLEGKRLPSVPRCWEWGAAGPWGLWGGRGESSWSRVPGGLVPGEGWPVGAGQGSGGWWGGGLPVLGPVPIFTHLPGRPWASRGGGQWPFQMMDRRGCPDAADAGCTWPQSLPGGPDRWRPVRGRAACDE